MKITLRLGDCIEILKEMDDNSVSSFVCDPPYDLVGNSRNGSPQPGDQSTPYGRSGPSKSKGFMGKEWDGTGIAFSQELWSEVLRVLKPNGVVKAFGGTRTFHRMALAMSESGLKDIRVEAWSYGSGFPKSYNIGKNVEATVLYGGSSPKQIADARAASGQEDLTENEIRHEFDREEWAGTGSGRYRNKPGGKWSVTTPEAKQWENWGTALKPAWEPVIVGRKPTV